MRVSRTGSIEEKIERLHEFESKLDAEKLVPYRYQLDLSWIYHDAALEGVVYGANELQAAINDEPVSDSSLIPIYDEIRNYKAAVDLIRSCAEDKEAPINLDTIKQIYLALDPDEAETKGPPKYRKEMPLHRLYFHEIAQPDKISYRMRQLVQWISSEETKKYVHPIRAAAKAHTMLIHIFPFPQQSGKVARLLMNLMLLREEYPLVIIHATERQRYYEALKMSDDYVSALIHESLENSVESALRYFYRLHGLSDIEM